MKTWISNLYLQVKYGNEDPSLPLLSPPNLFKRKTISNNPNLNTYPSLKIGIHSKSYLNFHYPSNLLVELHNKLSNNSHCKLQALSKTSTYTNIAFQISFHKWCNHLIPFLSLHLIWLTLFLEILNIWNILKRFLNKRRLLL